MRRHRLSTSFVLGYHGCKKAVSEKLINGTKFKGSRNHYDWLGHGIYFWESNPDRALSYAVEMQRRKGGDVNDVAVVGAVIDLGYCLDLLSQASLDLVKDAYNSFSKMITTAKQPMPVNNGGSDLLFRNLDCAVLNYLHESRKEQKKTSFSSVRGLFVEGGPLFEGSGFHSKTHIQICVRRTSNIKGVFRVT